MNRFLEGQLDQYIVNTLYKMNINYEWVRGYSNDDLHDEEWNSIVFGHERFWVNQTMTNRWDSEWLIMSREDDRQLADVKFKTITYNANEYIAIVITGGEGVCVDPLQLYIKRCLHTKEVYQMDDDDECKKILNYIHPMVDRSNIMIGLVDNIDINELQEVNEGLMKDGESSTDIWHIVFDIWIPNELRTNAKED